MININPVETRISKLRAYLFPIIDTLLTDQNYQINANMLSNDPNNYSLDKIPTGKEVERWINGTEIHREVYSLRSRNGYSQDVMSNIENIGFFETFENMIYLKNKAGELPEIDGIQSIECLNCGSMVDAESSTAEFDIQLQITYII